MQRLTVVFICGALAVLTVAADEPKDATTGREQASEALGEAKQTLSDLTAQLKKTNEDMEGQYRILKSDTYRRDREQQTESKSDIQRLQQERNDLWAARDMARLVLLQREAEFESADALLRIFELQSSGKGESAEVRKWQKKQEKAQARALKLQREVEVAEARSAADG